MDINDHVPNSIEEHFVDSVGFATLIDSLTAVKKLVFEDKVITMDELLKALDADFEGYEVLRQQLLNAPKFGNGDASTNLRVPSSPAIVLGDNFTFSNRAARSILPSCLIRLLDNNTPVGPLPSAP